MTAYEFNEIVSPLETLFSNISDSDIRDMYYNRFKSIDELIFRKAIGHIVDTHRTKTFPLPAEIYEAINGVKSEMITLDSPGEECTRCTGTGYMIEDCRDSVGAQMSYQHAIICPECTHGRARRRAWNLKDKNRRMRNKK